MVSPCATRAHVGVVHRGTHRGATQTKPNRLCRGWPRVARPVARVLYPWRTTPHVARTTPHEPRFMSVHFVSFQLAHPSTTQAHTSTTQAHTSTHKHTQAHTSTPKHTQAHPSTKPRCGAGYALAGRFPACRRTHTPYLSPRTTFHHACRCATMT